MLIYIILYNLEGRFFINENIYNVDSLQGLCRLNILYDVGRCIM